MTGRAPSVASAARSSAGKRSRARRFNDQRIAGLGAEENEEGPANRALLPRPEAVSYFSSSTTTSTGEPMRTVTSTVFDL